MNYLIKFIPGKNISTKSISDFVVTCHFEVPKNFNPNKFIDKPAQLVFNKIDWNQQFSLDCYMSSEWNSYYYSGTHKNYCIKLDIHLTDSLILWYIVSNEFETSIQLEE